MLSTGSFHWCSNACKSLRVISLCVWWSSLRRLLGKSAIKISKHFCSCTRSFTALFITLCKGYLVPRTNRQTFSWPSTTRDICCGMSSKLDLSVKEKRNRIPSAFSLQACKNKCNFPADGTECAHCWRRKHLELDIRATYRHDVVKLFQWMFAGIPKLQMEHYNFVDIHHFCRPVDIPGL